MAAQASKFGNQEGDGNQEHKTSDMTISHSDTDGGPAAKDGIPPVVAPSFQTGPENELPQLKDNPPQKHSASPQRRTTRTSGGYKHTVEHSPVHHHQARVANKGGGFSPYWERKGSSDVEHGAAHNTLGRSRLRVGGRADESPEDGSTIPKLGEWDDNDPSSADRFTGIFAKVREEKQTIATKVPMINDDSLYLNSYGHGSSGKESTGCFCFNWCRK